MLDHNFSSWCYLPLSCCTSAHSCTTGANCHQKVKKTGQKLCIVSIVLFLRKRSRRQITLTTRKKLLQRNGMFTCIIFFYHKRPQISFPLTDKSWLYLREWHMASRISWVNFIKGQRGNRRLMFAFLAIFLSCFLGTSVTSLLPRRKHDVIHWADTAKMNSSTSWTLMVSHPSDSSVSATISHLIIIQS